jgi:hypothetical protein
LANVVEYATVLARMTGEGFESLYFNSGAFGFRQSERVEIVGWMGPDDPSVRAEMKSHIRRVNEPYAESLASAVRQAWLQLLLGNLWLMPKSHWAYELDFGNRDWLGGALAELGIDSGTLQPLANGAAVQFDPGEADVLQTFLTTLFSKLHGSDFAIAFPGRGTLCTLHHHQQAWWQTNRIDLAERLRQMFE